MSKPEGYSIIIDTDSYAGNFEREMCAYITGEIGECEVGKDSAVITKRELEEEIGNWFMDNVSQVPDEHGCCRPVAIAEISKQDKDSVRPYNGVQIFFEKQPSDDIVDVIKSRARTYANLNKIKITRFRLIWTEIQETEKII